MIGLHTGLRLGEIINLTWKDIDLRRGILKVRPKKDWAVKDRLIRDIPLSDHLSELLARHPRHISSPYVLHLPDGKPLPDHIIRKALAQAGKRARISNRVHPHLLRHTFGTELVASGEDLDVVRRLLGHTDIKTTMIYLHAAPSRLSGAVQKIPFGRRNRQDMVTGQNHTSQ